MPTLYSYVLRYDTGLAPNPFFGTCSLVVCKPVVRRSASVGDWVVGLCSADQRRSAFGDAGVPGVVYAMEVTEKVRMEEYDALTRSVLPGKIPDPSSPDPARRAGDSLYDYSRRGEHGEWPALRPGLHDEAHRARDLGGQYALLSERFYYFGREPRQLPDHLSGVALYESGSHLRQGHLTLDLLGPFRSWIEGLGLEPNRVLAVPAQAPTRSSGCGGIPTRIGCVPAEVSAVGARSVPSRSRC